jgi:hypothetical protein
MSVGYRERRRNCGILATIVREFDSRRRISLFEMFFGENSTGVFCLVEVFIVSAGTRALFGSQSERKSITSVPTHEPHRQKEMPKRASPSPSFFHWLPSILKCQ